MNLDRETPENPLTTDDSEYFSSAAIEKRFQAFRTNPPAELVGKSVINDNKIYDYAPESTPSSKQVVGIVNQYLSNNLYYLDFPATYGEFKLKLGLSEFDFKSVNEAFKDSQKLVKRANRFLYWNFTLGEATALIVREAPELNAVTQELRVHTSFLDSIGAEVDDTEVIGYGAGLPRGRTNIITVPQVLDYQHIGGKQLLRTVMMAHEFFHSLNYHFMIKEFGVPAKLEPMEEKYSLIISCVEGFSLALEYLLHNQFSRFPDSPQLIPLRAFEKDRMAYLRHHAQFIHPRPRTTSQHIYSGDGEGGPDYIDEKVKEKQDIPELNYVEGAHLALMLHRNGWTIHDVPEIWHQVKLIVDDLINSRAVHNKDPQDFYNVRAIDGKYSMWTQVRARLRDVKPARDGKGVGGDGGF